MRCDLNAIIYTLRGDTLQRLITWINDDGTPVDISNYSFFFTIKSDQDDADADAEVKVDWSSHTDPENGQTTLIVPAASTDALLGEYYYDLQVKDGNGYITTILLGLIIFDKDITRRTS